MFTIDIENVLEAPCKPYIHILCLFGCLFVTDKRENGWIDRVHICCSTLRNPGNGLCIVRF